MWLLWNMAFAQDAWMLENVRIVDALGAREVAALVVEDGRIVHLGEAPPRDLPSVDARGATVVPGLIDAHVHLSMTPGGAFMTDADARALWPRHLAAYVACGVVAVLDTGITPEDAAVVSQLAAAGPAPSIRYLGPLVSPEGGYVSAVLPQFPGTGSVEALQVQLDAFAPLDPIGVKVTFEDGMPADIWPMHRPDVLAALRDQPLPLMAHAMDRHEYEMALDAGVSAFVHPPYAVDDALLARLDGIPVVTTISPLDSLLSAVEPERLDDLLVQLVVPEVELINGSTPATIRASFNGVAEVMLPRMPGFLRKLGVRLNTRARPLERRTAVLKRSVLALHNGGIELVAGSDSGNWPLFLYAFHGPTSIRELELLQAAGIPPADVLQIGTLNGARLLGLEAELGTVEGAGTSGARCSA